MAMISERIDDRLSLSQGIILVFAGAFLWSLGVASIRFGGPLGIFVPEGRALLYAVTALPMWLSVRLVAQFSGPAVVAGAAVSSMTALFLDGIALGWLPGLYSHDPQILFAGAVWLLWAGGMGFAFALWAEARGQ